jgi:hypothetical protein
MFSSGFRGKRLAAPGAIEECAIHEKVEKVYTEKIGNSLLGGYVYQGNVRGNYMKARPYFGAGLRG